MTSKHPGLRAGVYGLDEVGVLGTGSPKRANFERDLAVFHVLVKSSMLTLTPPQLTINWLNFSISKADFPCAKTEAEGEVGIVPLVDFANCAVETWWTDG